MKGYFSVQETAKHRGISPSREKSERGCRKTKPISTWIALFFAQELGITNKQGGLIREFDMQHEQWLFGGERYTVPVLKAIDEFMETPV